MVSFGLTPLARLEMGVNCKRRHYQPDSFLRTVQIVQSFDFNTFYSR